MALRFDAASTQYLESTAPVVLGYPFSVGMWIRLAAGGTVTRTLLGLSDTGTTNHFFDFRMSATEFVGGTAAAGGGVIGSNATGLLVPGEWAHVVCRYISSTNRRYTTTQKTGVGTGSGTSAVSPTGIDTLTIGALKTSAGASQPWDGDIAEYWIMSGDCYGTAAADITSDFAMALAYRGPKAVLRGPFEYRSFRRGIVSPGDVVRSNLAPVNGPLLVSDHPSVLRCRAA